MYQEMIDQLNPLFITLKNGEKLELLFDELATMALNTSPHELSKFVRLQVDETYEPPTFFHGESRGWVKRVIQTVVRKMSASSSGILLAVYRKLMNRLFPDGWFFGWSILDELNWAWNDASRLLDQNRFALARLDGKIVSIAACKLGGELEDKTQVFELTKFVTLPAYRGRGIYGFLRKELIRRIQNRFPDSPIITFTKNRTVINCCQKSGWKPVPLELYSEITRRIGRSGLSPEDRTALRHLKSFMLDPVSQSSN